MMYKYATERGLVMNSLADELAHIAMELERYRETGADTKEYRALLKSYTDAARLHLQLVKEVEAGNETPVDALAAFVGDGA